MLILQCGHRLAHTVVGMVGQWWKHVALFVFMVVRASHIEVAQHIARSRARLIVVTMGVHMLDDAPQQVQAALHALMARLQHFKRLFKSHSGRAQPGNNA